MVFTGIVQRVGKAFTAANSSQLTVKADQFFEGCQKGDSIAVNGVCLTLVEGFTPDLGVFFVMDETKSKTNLFTRTDVEFEVNLEKAMSHGQPVGGHYVLGHVVGTVPIQSRQTEPDGSTNFWIDMSSIPKDLRFIVHKGSIALSGISLTVAELTENTFRVSIVPHTLSHTHLGSAQANDTCNIEFDERLQQGLRPSETPQLYTDEDFMQEALRQSEKGRLTTAPNPWVGCVLVKDGKIIGTGYHVKAGTSHAEVIALTDAKNRGNAHLLEGATAYVTLEPCHHHGKTPPCDLALIEHKIGRVVIACPDPDSRVDSKGIQMLKQHMEVTVGVCEQEVSTSLEPYLHQRKTKIPYVVLKAALSLDGKISCADGSSQWITGEAVRNHMHLTRAGSQAIMIGTGTALADNPRLNVRLPEVSCRPLRVVLDAHGKVTEGNLLDSAIAPTLVFTSSECKESSRQIWTEKGIEVVVVDLVDGLLDLVAILQTLGKRNIIQLLVEGGGKLQSSFIRQKLVDKLIFNFGACLIGATGSPWAQTPFAETIGEVTRWELVCVKQFDNDICAEYKKKVH